ncbi:CGNR zinc finger domain-containing protein [Streptosporangium sp. NPDC051023]|uniref:CGNR zinc finger domain-containing protein n=1 Tax=Streptosporangium sp. NPDC051023 TaxID=3155410 RepID=UPI00344E6275
MFTAQPCALCRRSSSSGWIRPGTTAAPAYHSTRPTCSPPPGKTVIPTTPTSRTCCKTSSPRSCSARSAGAKAAATWQDSAVTSASTPPPSRGCETIFTDTSRTARQRYCSQPCANRDAVRRHRARQSTSPT